MRMVRFGVLLAAILFGGTAAAQSASGDIEQKRSDLEDLRKRIGELRKGIAETEQSHSEAAEAVAEAEREVSRLERELRRIAGERRAAERALALLENEGREVETRILRRQGELGEWLRHHYMRGGAGGVAPLLSSGDPNQIARDARYLEHIGAARLQLIESLRADLREKARLAGLASARRDRLGALEAEQAARRGEMEATQKLRQQALAVLSVQLRGQKKEVEGLRQDEQRLGRLIAVLARQAAAREAAAKAAAAKAAAAADAQRNPQASRKRAEAVVGEVRQAAGPTPTNVSFAQLRGKLRFPVRGELIGRFGAPRAEGGTTWRGVFIRAAGGEEVRAVAGGEVVFSDWLRGYGNLIIVDHGDDYLSIYGNNDTLLREVGDRIAGGDALASVGASGGGTGSGLYFEIRYQGRPLDPMQWVRLN